MVKLLIIYLTLFLIMSVGWVLNFITVKNYDHIELTGLVILQIIGIFLPPIGAIMGFLF